MFSVELRVNGSLISHIYGRNVSLSNDIGIYNYEYYEVEKGELKTGTVTHNRSKGLTDLVTTILNDVGKRDGKVKKV